MQNEKFLIVDKMNEKQFDQLHVLQQQMWWSAGRTKEDIRTLIKNCLVFAAIEHDTLNLVGFARVLMDELRYAFIFDMMVIEQFRNNGIGKMIMSNIFLHPQLQNVKYFELTCSPNMISYYQQFQFSKDHGSVVPMRYTKSI